MPGWIKSIFGGAQEPAHAEGDKPIPNPQKAPRNQAWIGVDLDGTLAEYGRWSGMSSIGKPVPAMKQRVLEWVEAGYRVKVVTARASEKKGIPPVEKWLAKHGFPPLEVTNEKDFAMIELWDDRAVQVVANTGKPVILPTMSARPKAPLFRDEEAGETFELARMREEPPEEANEEEALTDSEGDGPKPDGQPT